MKTQEQHYYNAVRKNAEADRTFLMLVKNGMTKTHLQKNIDRRPSLWSKYSNWLNILPA